MTTKKTEAKPKGKKFLSFLARVLLTAAICCLVVFLIRIYINLDGKLYTNDAQIEENISPISTRVTGYVKEVRFREHELVKKGDTLVVIDNREYSIQLAQAKAVLVSALAARKVSLASVKTVSSNRYITNANIVASIARLRNAEQNYLRYKNLLSEGAVTRQQYDQMQTEYFSLRAQTEALNKQLNTTNLLTEEASNRIAINDGDIEKAAAAVKMAELNLSYTIITAPYEGITGRRNVQEGQLLQASQVLLSIIRSGEKWVVANYKETQVASLYLGQPVMIHVDALDNTALQGTVTSISQATGARFTALPVDNSAGNFVKVQQRIPVRIDFTDKKQQAAIFQKLRAGMNVEVHVP
jgi:membrane fusion protein, multidrug efflux system